MLRSAAVAYRPMSSLSSAIGRWMSAISCRSAGASDEEAAAPARQEAAAARRALVRLARRRSRQVACLSRGLAEPAPLGLWGRRACARRCRYADEGS